MSKRFATLPAKGGTKLEPINWGDPGDYRNRGNSAVKPRSSSKRLQAYYDANYGTADIPASTAKASESTSAPAKASAPAKPKAPVKSAAMIAVEAYAARAAKVMSSPAAAGRKKVAAQLLGKTSASADQIINFLATAETDAQREQAEIDATWKTAIEKANAGMAGLGMTPAQSEISDIWKRAIAKVEVFGC